MALYLVDGHALAYRAYYAFIRRPLVTSRGEETSAVFGFAKTVLQILEKFDPEHLGVVFDSTEETFRHKIYPAYKANREKMPEALIEQLPGIFSFLEAMSIPSFNLSGYEADDIIATISSALEEAAPVRIISGDKDLFQLITERTHVIRPGKGGLLEEEIDPPKLAMSTGLRPGQFVDFLSLVGDPSDNIPGVRGVGEKTALKLVQEFGSLEGLYERIDEVASKSLRQRILEGREDAFMSRRLVKLDRSVPISVSMDDLVRREPRVEQLEEVLRGLEFMKMLDSFGVKKGKSKRPEEKRYSLVRTEEGLEQLASKLGGVDEFALDVEASELDPMRAVLSGIAIATAPGRAWYVPIKSRIEEEEPTLTPPRESQGLDLELARRYLGPVFADPSKKKIGQNIKYDAIVLSNSGFKLEGIDFDTMLASYCLHPARRSHALESLALEFFGHKMTTFKELFDSRSKRKDIREVQVERVKDYACEDADYAFRLKEVFEGLLKASQVEGLFREVEMPLCQVLTEMEMAGVKLDLASLDSLSGELSRNLRFLEEDIYEEAGERFNINSTVKLREILFEKLSLTPSHKTKTGYSTDVEVLKSLSRQHRLPLLLLEYRTLVKLKNTYIDALPKLVNSETGRVHTSYNQAVTSTGRLSSSNPNLQNIPIRTPIGRKIRKAFTSSGDDWVLLDADYSQVELRILAHLSRDLELLRAFREGTDIHRKTAAMILGVKPEEVTEEMRSRAKTVNFGIIYGMGSRGLSQALGIDFKDARKFIDDYFSCYPGVKHFIDETVAKARRERAVSTLLGRIRQLPDIESPDGRVRSSAERIAVNTPVQGTAADIIKTAMVKISRALEERHLGAKMILQVHDELVFDVPGRELQTVEEIVKRTMESAISLDVPLEVEIGVGKNWFEAHG